MARGTWWAGVAMNWRPWFMGLLNGQKENAEADDQKGAQHCARDQTTSEGQGVEPVGDRDGASETLGGKTSPAEMKGVGHGEAEGSSNVTIGQGSAQREDVEGAVGREETRTGVEATHPRRRYLVGDAGRKLAAAHALAMVPSINTVPRRLLPPLERRREPTRATNHTPTDTGPKGLAAARRLRQRARLDKHRG